MDVSLVRERLDRVARRIEAAGGHDRVRVVVMTKGYGVDAVTAAAESVRVAECSMGMTGDLEVAVEEGSTMVRIGQGLFGPRSQRQSTARIV